MCTGDALESSRVPAGVGTRVSEISHQIKRVVKTGKA